MKKISVIGAGAFGFAIAKYLGDKINNENDFHKSHDELIEKIMLFDVDSNLIEDMKINRTQKYFFKDSKLSNNVFPTDNIKNAVEDSDLLIIAIPTQFLRGFLKNAQSFVKNDCAVLNCSKGIELSSYKLISDIVKEELGERIFGVLSGGMIASEFIEDRGFFGAEIACNDEKTGKILQHIFSSRKLRVYLNDDVVGVEIAGSLKNVISIACGMVDGMKMPYGTKTFITSLGAYDIKSLGEVLGAKNYSFNLYTQAFGNDFIMSTTGNTRNRYFGELIGSGLSVEETLQKMKDENKTVEGYFTTKAAYEIALKNNIDVPIVSLVYRVLYENALVKEEFLKIMSNKLEKIKKN